MENTESYASTMFHIIGTWLVFLFLNYRLAVYGKEQRGQKMWLSLLVGLGIGFFPQFVYNIWGVNFKTPLKKWKANLAFSILFIISLMFYAAGFDLIFSYYFSWWNL
jgi:hypothetical protein